MHQKLSRTSGDCRVIVLRAPLIRRVEVQGHSPTQQCDYVPLSVTLCKPQIVSVGYLTTWVVVMHLFVL